MRQDEVKRHLASSRIDLALPKLFYPLGKYYSLTVGAQFIVPSYFLLLKLRTNNSELITILIVPSFLFI